METGQVAFAFIVFAIIVMLVAVMAQSRETELEKKYGVLTCDELAFEITDNEYSIYAKETYKKKCIPYELQKASLLEISEYFSNQNCNDLVQHIVKRHFEFEQAELIYKFKCGDPANINFTSVEIDYDKSPKVEEHKPQSNRGRG